MNNPHVSFTNKFILSIVLLFVLFPIGLIAVSVWAKEAKQSPTAPGANNLIWLNRIAFALLFLLAIVAIIFLLGIVL